MRKIKYGEKLKGHGRQRSSEEMLDCGPSHEKFYEQPITGIFAN